MLSQSSGLDLPIGTILPYTGDLNKIPRGWVLCDGTNGTPDLTGRFLEGALSDIGQFKEAGLPNIRGEADQFDEISDRGGNHYGALYYSDMWHNHSSIDASPGGGPDWTVVLWFDASRCNPIYGRSDTVQPASYTVYYIMRVK